MSRLVSIQPYQCHKQVLAFEIGKIEGNKLFQKGDDDAFIEVDHSYISKHPLNQDGYYVRYEDGYESFSPKAVFEAGYTVIGGSARGVMSDEDAERVLAQSPGDRVTKESIEKRITDIAYLIVPDTTVTICHIVLDNGFSVRGESACVDHKNFNKELGEKYAYENAFEKLWTLFGFLLAEQRSLPFDKCSNDWAGYFADYLANNNLAPFTKITEIVSAMELTLRNYKAKVLGDLKLTSHES